MRIRGTHAREGPAKRIGAGFSRGAWRCRSTRAVLSRQSSSAGLPTKLIERTRGLPYVTVPVLSSTQTVDLPRFSRAAPDFLALLFVQRDYLIVDVDRT